MTAIPTEERLPWISWLADDDGDYDYQEHMFTLNEAMDASGENPDRYYMIDRDRMEWPPHAEAGGETT